jgi:hypothetical protein
LKRADIIRHTGVDDLGSFRPVLERHGYALRLLEPFADDLDTIDAAEADVHRSAAPSASGRPTIRSLPMNCAT